MNVLGVPENILKLAVSGKIQNDFLEHKNPYRNSNL